MHEPRRTGRRNTAKEGPEKQEMKGSGWPEGEGGIRSKLAGHNNTTIQRKNEVKCV